jgi:3-phenylpropionate/trans-cinnamate dioxygenase ferredoxin reductase subunit
MNTIAIAGASLAGLRAAESLRRLGFSGRIALVGAEPHRPYDRPPLSKEILQGKWGPERTALRREGTWDELALDWRLGVRATALELGARELALSDGSRLRFDGLVIATGATPRALRGQPALAGVHTLRTLDDALAIRSALEKSPRVAVVGAGFIGAEVAASCRARGLDVVVIEALPAPLSRGLGMQMGELCAALHRDHGVDLRTGVGVAALEGGQRVERVRLSDGGVVAADLVVVGIGVSPETAWLEGSGLRLEDGVVCDATCTAAPGVVAAGDVARWTNPLFDGESMRVEHWTNAVEQGAAAAAALLAGPDAAQPFANVPFFWSDQYDVKIQFAGRSAPDDELLVVDGSLAERRFVALYGRRGRLVGALAFSRPRLAIAYRRLIAARASWEEALAFAARPS